jgi:OOP family OmpA-OmpF porin
MHRPLLLTAVSLLAASLATPTFAQDGAQDGEFSVQRFEPAAGTGNYLGVEGARMETEFGWSAGLYYNYSRDPFVVVSCQSETNCDDPNAQNVSDVAVVQDQMTWDLLGSFNPAKFVQIGLRVPLTYVSGDGIDTASGGPSMEGISAFGLGDPNLEGKVRFYGDPKDLFVLGAALDVSFPLGSATSEGNYIGNDSGNSPVAVGLRGIFDGKSGPFSFGLNLKGIYRGENTLGSTTVGPVEFRYGVGGGYQISPLLQVLAEGFGATQFSSKNGTNTLEIDGALRITPLDTGLAFTAGGGAGVIEGVGVPVGRGLVGVVYAHEVGDKDGDGLDDLVDNCPTEPEDRDQFEDDDGCPDDDNDGDKVLDVDDKCPLEPETINGLDDADGCPDAVKDTDADGIPDDKDKCPEQPGKVRTPEFYGCADTDQDGVPDPKDKCVTEPEDTDGFEDLDGCPDPDNDQDGILDQSDECVDTPEIKNGYKDEDGCPDELPDQDKDGIPDKDDKCPTRPENLNGVQDDDGCPDAGASLVEVGAEEIKILQRVEFATGSDKIQGQVSFRVLGAVAGALKNNPQIFLVEIAGHTDNVGPAPANKDLSQKRAEAVVEYLKSQGVEAGRMKAMGYGPDKPIADNGTPQGRQTNRRVEFNILKSAKPKP